MPTSKPGNENHSDCPLTEMLQLEMKFNLHIENNKHELGLECLQKAFKLFPSVQILYRIAEMVLSISNTPELLRITVKILEKCDRMGLLLEKQEQSGKLPNDKEYQSFLDVEFESLNQARQRLTLIYCQENNPKSFKLLQRLGQTRRLSSYILDFNASAQDIESKNYCYYYDDFLLPDLLNRMQGLFKSNAQFWVKHDYNEFKSTGYFSYVYSTLFEPSNFIEQIIDLIYQRIQLDDPSKAARIKYAEWWAHCRPHHMGHQFHYDSENEGQGQVKHPLYSTVLYLDSSVGGPTIITNQTLNSNMADKGWSIYPKDNRLAIFDSQHLHGVVPGKGPTPNIRGRRVTFMVGFWDSITIIDTPGHGASRVYPNDLISEFSIKEAKIGFNLSEKGNGQKLRSVWQDQLGNELTDLTVQHYEKCFQGF